MSVMWFRQDLRLRDNPALLAAAEAATGDGGHVVPLIAISRATWGRIGPVQRRYLAASWDALDDALGGSLVIRIGDPTVVVPEVAHAAGARTVHIARDFSVAGERRDRAVQAALGGIRLVRTGSAYAVAPGTIRKADGTPYRVFTPYYRAWLAHGWHAPAPDAPAVRWRRTGPSDALPVATADDLDAGDVALPEAGEASALTRWEAFDSADYSTARDRPDLDATSRMSIPLHIGEVHPRTLLARFAAAGDTDHPWVRQLAWRDFYADVLLHNPRSTTHSLDARFDDPSLWHSDDDAGHDDAFTAWADGRTGYPFIDAGMRQLRAEGWMHNRVRMAVASFLVKDLHLPWQRGAAHFMRALADADPASNAHGWQWTAGCGTDPSPFHRVFNPVLQGQKFDPAGDYLRRHVPELAHLAGAGAHEPWKATDGYAHGYPERIVDHATERLVALDLLDRLKARRPTSPRA